MKFEVKHLCALAFAGLVATFGVFLFREITDCKFADEKCFRYDLYADYRIYGHRPYGIALVVIAVAFSAAIIRHAKKDKQA